jgi:pyridoxamine 5'-phosphate oxidase
VEHERTLSAADLTANPMLQFRRWFEAAEAEGITLVNAMALATADAHGRPSVRHVLLREFGDRGFVFYTNYESRKGGELAENPHGALTILWKELDRQVCATGPVERVSREESEVYFRTRPREARIGAWASPQSRVLGSREELDARYAEVDARYPGDEVPLPPFWGGFVLWPETIEFWQGRPFRLHDRFRYSRDSTEGWTFVRLSP